MLRYLCRKIVVESSDQKWTICKSIRGRNNDYTIQYKIALYTQNFVAYLISYLLLNILYYRSVLNFLQHSAYDGMATMDGCVFALMEISKQKPSITKYLPELKLENTKEWFENKKDIVGEIEFELNSEIQQYIIHAKKKLSEKMENLYMELKCFKNYGKTAIKEMKIHPDAFMQIAIQIAGYKTGGK